MKFFFARSGIHRPRRHNPAGSKLLRRVVKHRFGERCTYEEAKKLYRSLPGRSVFPGGFYVERRERIAKAIELLAKARAALTTMGSQ